MIDKIELMAFSRQFGLRASVVEKDYVLGWVLAGIFHHKEIGDAGECQPFGPLKSIQWPAVNYL